MLIPIRPNVYLGDKDAFKSPAELVEKGIQRVIVVADDLLPFDQPANSDVQFYKIGLRSDRINAPHIKDLACHVPKYMVQNGESVLIQSVTGLQRGAYIVCRMLCELEGRTIYEIMNEIKELLPQFDINKSYF